MKNQVDIKDLAGDLAANTPAAAIDRPAGKKPAVELSQMRDKHGRGFDPELHETDGDGNPVLNPIGTLRLKSGPGPKKGKSYVGARKPQAASRAVAADDPADQAAAEQLKMTADMESKMLCGMYWPIAQTVGGPNCFCESDRRAMLEKITAEYLEKTGGLNLTPLQGFLLGIAFLHAEQATKPEVREHFLTFIGRRPAAGQEETEAGAK